MRQAFIRKGRAFVDSVPAPSVSRGTVLIKVVYSCVSAGTEMAGLEASEKKSLLKRLIQEPEKVAKAWQMTKEIGARKTASVVVSKLKKEDSAIETAKPIGYSLAGIVVAVGEDVNGVSVNDRVAAAGSGIASHADYVEVPENLVMRMPENLDYKLASTVTLGGIAMQGVRRAYIQLGEYVVVFGAGILGLLTVQMVRAAGGRCIAVDLSRRRLELAKCYGAEITLLSGDELDPVRRVIDFTGGYGADVVIYTAATSDSDVLSQAFAMTRKKGRLIMVGVYGRELRRDDVYRKEIDFLISTSYGPGRYDEMYEQKGLDYPYAYVRWTEKRNMVEYLRLLAVGAVDINSMVDAVFSIDNAAEAYGALKLPDRPLFVLLNYGDPPRELSPADSYTPDRFQVGPVRVVTDDRIRVGIIGAGNFAKAVHLPNLHKLADTYELVGICNRKGFKAKQVAEQFGANYATTDYREIVNDDTIDLVMICTRHNLHGSMVLESLRSGKHTFVEKPLCVTHEELDEIQNFFVGKDMSAADIPFLMVGFNRRFSPLSVEIKEQIKNRVTPLFIHYRMNAGYVPSESWIHTDESGGRIVGEACHLLDLFSFFTEGRIKSFSTASLSSSQMHTVNIADNKFISLEYTDGSIAALDYFSIGAKDLSKEWLEIHFDGKSIILDNYQNVSSFGLELENPNLKKPDKGHYDELVALGETLRGERKEWPISLISMFETTRLTLEAR